MARKKKKGDKAKADDDSVKPKSGGKLLGLLAPLAVFGAAFGASWFAAPDAPVQVVEAVPDAEKTAATHAAGWTPATPDLTLDLDPLTITAGGEGQVLKIGLALELWDRHAEIDTARLRDAFTAYLRAVDPDQLANPSFHMRLKRALLHRARIVSGEDIVADVLITDFLLTS